MDSEKSAHNRSHLPYPGLVKGFPEPTVRPQPGGLSRVDKRQQLQSPTLDFDIMQDTVGVRVPPVRSERASAAECRPEPFKWPISQRDYGLGADSRNSAAISSRLVASVSLERKNEGMHEVSAASYGSRDSGNFW